MSADMFILDMIDMLPSHGVLLFLFLYKLSFLLYCILYVWHDKWQKHVFTIVKDYSTVYCFWIKNSISQLEGVLEKSHFFFFFFPSFFFLPFLSSSFLKLPRPLRTMQPLHQACSCRVKGQNQRWKEVVRYFT